MSKRVPHRDAIILATLILSMTAGSALASALAVLQPENLSDSAPAREELMSLMLDGLADRGIEEIDLEDARAALRRHRIRSVGQIGAQGTAALVECCAATDVLVWSIVFYQEHPPYETTLVARLVDAEDGAVRGSWIASHANGEGLDWLATNEVTSAADTARRCVAEIVDGVAATLAGERELTRNPNMPPVAVIPLETWSRDRRDAARATRLLVGALLEEGIGVLEPGYVHETLVQAAWSAQGAIPEAASRVLRWELGAVWILTGTIDQFSLASGARGEAPPEIAGGLRILRANSGRPIWAWEGQTSGADQSGLFERGRIPALGRLSEVFFRSFVHEIPLQLSR